MKKNKDRFDQEEEQSRVKMYKTHHGWVSCLTRFFQMFSFGTKEEVHPQTFVDPDAMNDKASSSTEAYMKGLAALTTILGVGGVAAANPTAVHAATQTVNTDSQVIGWLRQYHQFNEYFTAEFGL